MIMIHEGSGKRLDKGGNELIPGGTCMEGGACIVDGKGTSNGAAADGADIEEDECVLCMVHPKEWAIFPCLHKVRFGRQMGLCVCTNAHMLKHTKEYFHAHAHALTRTLIRCVCEACRSFICFADQIPIWASLAWW